MIGHLIFDDRAPKSMTQQVEKRNYTSPTKFQMMGQVYWYSSIPLKQQMPLWAIKIAAFEML